MLDSSPTPAHQIGLITKAWRALFGEPVPVEIWQTEREVFLRHEDAYSLDPSWPLDTYAIYAVYQVSLTTGTKRIIERSRLV